MKYNGDKSVLCPQRVCRHRVIAMRLLLPLLLAGCATISTEELYTELGTCISAGQNCEEIQARVNSRENLLQYRENAKMICPDGYVAHCDTRMRGCGSRRTVKPVEYVCISRRAVGDMLALHW